MVFLIIIIIK